MQAQGIQCIRYEVTAITPRRWGKTWAVAMYVLALMLAVPGIRVCVFSTGKRASSSLMEIITQFMGMIPGLNERKVKENVRSQQCVHIAAENHCCEQHMRSPLKSCLCALSLCCHLFSKRVPH